MSTAKKSAKPRKDTSKKIEAPAPKVDASALLSELCAAPTVPAKAARPYPLHVVETIDEKGKKSTTEHPYLALPEAVGITPPLEGFHLFCPACRMLVAVESSVRAQAEEAAAAEGVGPIKVGPPLPGSLSEPVRVGLYLLHTFHRLTQKETIAKAARSIYVIGATLHAEGYVTAISDEPKYALTPAGEAMAAQIAAPEVPAFEGADPAQTAARDAEAKRREKSTATKKARAAKPALPMVCLCGCGPREHLNAAGADVPCKACGATKCRRYRQIKKLPRVELPEVVIA